MIIHTIRLYNFGVYLGEHEINPATHGPGERLPITLIGGINGVGKTSLLDAVLLTLYGSRSPSAREHGLSYSAYLSSLISRDAPPDIGSWVELDLDVREDEGPVSLRVRRSWRRTNSRTIEKLEVWRNGNLDKYMADTWDMYVEGIVPLGLAGLFFFDGEKISALAESEDMPDHVQQAIRALLGLDLVDRLITDLAVIAKRNSRLGKSDAQDELTMLQEDRTALEMKRQRAKQEASSVQNELDRGEERLRRMQEEYLKDGGAMANNRQQTLSRQDDLRAEVAQLKADLSALASGALPLILAAPTLSRIREAVFLESQADSARAALPLIRERNSQLLGFLREHVGTNKLREDLFAIIESQQSEIEKRATISNIFEMTTIGIGQLDDFVLRLGNELHQSIESTIIAYKRARAELVDIERHLTVQVDAGTANIRLQEIAEFTGHLAETKHRRDQIHDEILSFTRNIERVGNRLTILAGRLVEVDVAARIAQYALRSQETMRVFRERLTEQKICFLAQKINEAFSFLTHKTTFIEEMSIDVDTLRITLLDGKGREIPKVRLSSGEKQMLAIAILWGLAQASNRSLPVIIDTPMGRLDSSHRANFITGYLPKASHQVIVLSTDTEIVGSYLEPLKEYIGKQYILCYDDSLQQTKILPGYFDSAGGDDNVRQAG